MPPEPEADVTLVTRNTRAVWIEALLVAAAFYYISHPDIFEQIKDGISEQTHNLMHRLSIARVWMDIRNLPEADA